MANTINSNKIFKAQKDTVIYSLDEVCPICGCYEPDGNVCKECLVYWTSHIK